MKNSRNVAVLIGYSQLHMQEVLQGIADYANEHPAWSVNPMWSTDDWSQWQGDGALISVANEKMAQTAQQLHVPLVDISGERLVPSLPWVEADNTAVGRLAAEHLLERGYKHFGFCMIDQLKFSQLRRDEFERCIRAAGFSCSVYSVDSELKGSVHAETDQIAEWLHQLPKPVGVMTTYIFRGQQVLRACRTLGLAVPEEVGVVSVYGGEAADELLGPPLSSVILNRRRSGYEAAALLDRIMDGDKVAPGEGHLIAPIGVVARSSTATMSTQNRPVTMALRYIQDHACEGIQMKDILKVVPLSRHTLEYQFKQVLGRTPHEEILRVRLDHAKMLLAKTELSVAQVAKNSGFKKVEHFYASFRQQVACSPGQYRAQQG